MTTPEIRAAGNEAMRARGAVHDAERLAAYDRGLRGAELAAALGVAPGSVRATLTRARRRLGVPTPSRKSEAVAYCGDCGSTKLHEGPNDPPPWCCCMVCGSCNVIEVS
jgi:DNA-binding CsgD family transcriptional regulator